MKTLQSEQRGERNKTLKKTKAKRYSNSKKKKKERRKEIG
jgi:hypothetical protein